MSEINVIQFCNSCNKDTIFNFSGSGKKGVCMDCGLELPEDEQYSGSVLDYDI